MSSSLAHQLQPPQGSRRAPRRRPRTLQKTRGQATSDRLLLSTRGVIEAMFWFSLLTAIPVPATLADSGKEDGGDLEGRRHYQDDEGQSVDSRRGSNAANSNSLRHTASAASATGSGSAAANLKTAHGLNSPKELSRYNATLAFEWRAEAWTECKYRDRSSCCDCYRHRKVNCVRKVGSGGLQGQLIADQVPPFYCRKLLPVAPHNEEKCAPCRQPCVMSVWGAWSECSATCSPALKYRTRAVLLPASHGGKGCGNLLEVKPCDKGKMPCKIIDPRPEYKWEVLPWTSCRKPNNTRTCSQGLRTRQVLCLTKDDRRVSALFCRHHLTDLEPADTEPCDPPCDCRVSHWSSWGPCSVTCQSAHGQPYSGGYQVRTRIIKHAPEHSGMDCPNLRETRICRDTGRPQCPTYVWHLSEWSECGVPGEPDDCGSGLRRRSVICIRQGDITKSPVSDTLCMQDRSETGNSSALVRPAEEEACQVPCPTDCELGEWQNWSSCTKSCGTGGSRVRQKPILMRATRGGKECEERYETRPCEKVPCQWWHAGQWTRCFLPTMLSPDACGAGTQVRNVYCLNALDEVLSDDHCSSGGQEEQLSIKPPTQQACRVPCKDDCRVSPWSQWVACSVSCGVTGGLQKRTRIVLSNGTSDNPCLSPEELVQTRVCNQRPCRQYLWQAAPWSPCVRTANATAPCGNATGVQNRVVHCEMDPGYHVNNSLCDRGNMPVQQRVCDAPCPRDCQLSSWSQWSQCSHTCGSHSYKVRTRRVVFLAMHGGTACPPQADPQGVVVQKKRCKRVPECHTYHWEVGSWTPCLMDAKCGHGIQKRNVSCLRSDEKHVKDDSCYEQSPGSPPDTGQACFLPCPGDCELSAWSAWSSCSQTCGHNTPGSKTRTRHILKLDGGIDAATQCPHLQQSDLVEILDCGQMACPNFTWIVGDWGSCIVHKMGAPDELLPCGDGVRRRHVLCQRSDGAQVPHHHCDVIAMPPEKHEPCAVPCQRDCRYRAWSDWAPCSQPCGEGIKTRTRGMVEEAEVGGRACSQLEENTTCSIRDCALFEWKVAPWGDCRPYYGIDCGQGEKKRNVVCRAGAGFETECYKRAPRPPDSVACDVPCLGDCVTTEWSEWSSCSCRPNATRWRYRNVTKEALPSAHQCGPLEEDEPCYCPLYSVVTGEWTTCEIKRGNGNHCGTGVQKRPSNCIREDGVMVSMSLCTIPLVDEPTERPCELPCPVDCELTKFTPWSHCSAECGLTAYKERLRSVLTTANTWGRQCPPLQYLVQNTTCHTTPCYTFQWSRQPWSLCSVRTGSCGIGSRERRVECVRSDGMAVDEADCFTEDDREDSLDDLDPHVRKERDLHTQEPCGEPCPGDCQVSSWSRYGPCFKDCAAPGAVSIQVRTRVVLKPASKGRGACPSHLMEVRPCRRDEVYCPTFYWKIGEWTPNNARIVSCMAHEHLEVSSGCPRDLKPSSSKRCSMCGQYARCVEGSCTCMQGFTGDGHSCLPEYGCEDNSHCVVNSTYCDVMNKECLCAGGLLPDDALQCPVMRQGDGRGLFETGLSTLVLYIVIGSVCCLVILTLICTICFISRRKKAQPNENYPNLNKIDNLDTMHKNNELRGKDIVVIHKFGTADKNLKGAYGNPRYQPHIHSYKEESMKDGHKELLDSQMAQICLLDPDDDLFGNNSDSSTKPLMDDPDYIPMYGANTPESGGSASTNSFSPSTPNSSRYGTTSPGTKFGRSYGIDDRINRGAPPLPPPNHTGPRSTSSQTLSPKNNSTHQVFPSSATYENNNSGHHHGVRTFPRSEPRGDPDGGSGGGSPWQIQRSPPVMSKQQNNNSPSRGQQTLPRPGKKVWFPQAGDAQPSSRSQQNIDKDDVPDDVRNHNKAQSGQVKPLLMGRHNQKRPPPPPLKPKPKNLPVDIGLSAKDKSVPRDNTSEDPVVSGDPPMTPNGLHYPKPPPKMEDKEGAAAAGSRLMEYCDELLQELESIAKA